MSSSGLWQWQYKECLKVKSEVPTFKIPGRSYLFGFFRYSLDSSQLHQTECCLIFCKLDHSVIHFSSEISSALKSSSIIGKNSNNIHLIVTCESLEEFDQKVKLIPSDINIFADVGGKVAELFGIRPKIPKVDMKSLFASSEDQQNITPKYERQTLSGIFFLLNGRVAKSPAMQPKLQQGSLQVSVIKNGFEFFEKCNHDFNMITAKGSLYEELSEKELQTLQPQQWKLYEKEHEQMLQDLGMTVKKSTTTSTVSGTSKSTGSNVSSSKTNKSAKNASVIGGTTAMTSSGTNKKTKSKGQTTSSGKEISRTESSSETGKQQKKKKSLLTSKSKQQQKDPNEIFHKSKL